MSLVSGGEREAKAERENKKEKGKGKVETEPTTKTKRDREGEVLPGFSLFIDVLALCGARVTKNGA